jgi:hypothetical protein
VKNNNSITGYPLGYGDRIEFLSADIFPHHLNYRAVAVPSKVLEFIKSTGNRMDIPGYIIPTTIGGPNDQTYNVFPQSSFFNRGLYATEMAKIRSALVSRNATSVRMLVRFHYGNCGILTRPTSLTYRFHTRWATTGPPEVCNDMLNL